MEVVNKANTGLVGGIIVAIAGIFGITPTPEEVTILSGAILAAVSGVIILKKWLKGRSA